MSGLEPLAALGLACSVMQVISFSKELITTGKSIFRTGKVDPALSQRTDRITSLLEGLELRLGAPQQQTTKEHAALTSIARSSLATARELQAEIDSIASLVTKGKFSSAVRGSLRATWRKKKIERLEKSMATCQKALETGVILRIWYVTHAMSWFRSSDSNLLP